MDLPDPESNRGPENTAALKKFKDKLMRSNGNVRSEDIIDDISTLPISKANELHMSYDKLEIDDEEQEQNEDIDMDNISSDEPTESIPQAPVFNKFNTGKDPMHMLVDYLEATPAKEEVKIIGTFGRIGFKAVNVSINEYGVAFIIKKDAIQFEPNINTQLKVNYRGQDYDVIYAGGFFTFPKIPFTFVSFLRVTGE
jgi:hypothetical protein